MLSRLRKQAGDTIIEVLFAVAVFSAIAVGAIVIMNQGISSAQASLEINLVRNQIDTQAELLRHLHDGALTSIGRNSSPAAAQWHVITSNHTQAAASPYDTIVTEFSECRPDTITGGGRHPFFIDPSSGRIVSITNTTARSPATYAQVRAAAAAGAPSTSEMIWIEAVSRPNASDATLDNTNFYDFHIRACWDSPGAKTVMKLGTIVRLYVPVN